MKYTEMELYLLSIGYLQINNGKLINGVSQKKSKSQIKYGFERWKLSQEGKAILKNNGY